jgi:hypothetical protein
MKIEAIKTALANLNKTATLCDLPDAEFVTGGAITTACHEAGYDESGRATINQLNMWRCTVEELEATLCEHSAPRELRLTKITIYGAAMADVKHSEGSDRIQLNPEYHFVNGDQGTDEKCLSADGADFLESELKRLNFCEDVTWAK